MVLANPPEAIYGVCTSISSAFRTFTNPLEAIYGAFKCHGAEGEGRRGGGALNHDHDRVS